MIGHGVPGIDIRQEHQFATSAAALFTALTLGLDSWWPDEARVLGNASLLTLTPSPGGSPVETTTDGQGVIWGMIDQIEPERRLYFNGWFGIPGIVAGRVHFDVVENSSGARLSLLQQAIGPVPEDYVNRRSQLWRKLLDKSLRAYVTEATV